MSEKMTIEETIKGLQSMILSTKFIEHDFNGVVDEDVCERAIELLKEQETIFERDGHHIRCIHCNSYWCSTDREENTFPTNYCPNCGRKVKWDD